MKRKVDMSWVSISAFVIAIVLLFAVCIAQTVILKKTEKEVAYIRDNAYFVVEGEVADQSEFKQGFLFVKVGDKIVLARIFLDQSIMFESIGYPAKGQKVKLLKNGTSYFLLSVLSLEDNNE